MYRYTTPTIPITIEDIDFSEVDNFRVKIKDEKTELLFVVPADDESVDAENNTFYVSLTQQQTAQLKKGHAWLQVRVVYSGGSVQATPKAVISVNDVLDEVIV